MRVLLCVIALVFMVMMSARKAEAAPVAFDTGHGSPVAASGPSENVHAYDAQGHYVNLHWKVVSSITFADSHTQSLPTGYRLLWDDNGQFAILSPKGDGSFTLDSWWTNSLIHYSQDPTDPTKDQWISDAH